MLLHYSGHSSRITLRAFRKSNGSFHRGLLMDVVVIILQGAQLKTSLQKSNALLSPTSVQRVEMTTGGCRTVEPESCLSEVPSSIGPCCVW